MIASATQSHASNGLVTKQQFKQEVQNWGRETGIEIGGIQIRKLKNRWSSCSEGGRLTFDARLLEKSREFRKSVVIRQIMNLKMNDQSRTSGAFLKVFFGGSMTSNSGV